MTIISANTIVVWAIEFVVCLSLFHDDDDNDYSDSILMNFFLRFRWLKPIILFEPVHEYTWFFGTKEKKFQDFEF